MVSLLAAMPLATAQKRNRAENIKSISVTTGESIFIHANASTLITGETLYCKIYCLNPADKTASTISKIAYVELVDSDKKSVFKHKLNLEKGIAQGDFFIPTTLKTGHYKLVGYTMWMLNSSASNFFEMDIAIINPFQPLDKMMVIDSTFLPNDISTVRVISSDQFSIKTDKNVYGHREKVQLHIQALSKQNKGNYSISIRKIDALPIVQQPTSKIFPKQNNPTAIASQISILPELRGELFSGTIVSKSGKAVANKSVALSIRGKSFAFKLAKTDKSGKFIFILDKNPIAGTAIIQVLENDRDDYQIALDAENKPNFAALQFPETVALSRQNQLDIEQRSIATQIENGYYERKKDSIDAEMYAPSFFHPLEKRYVLDDYTRFPTLRETITEVILEMYSVKKGDQYSIHLRNNSLDPEVYGQPLILIDGLLVQDTNALYDFNMENVYAVDLINYPYVYGSKTFSGVANFITKTNDYENKASGDFIKEVALARPAIGKHYYNPTYEPGNSNKRIPDYRQQLLWQPQTTLENDQNALSFYTSDVSGKFEIVLEGFTEDGISVSAKEYMEVR